MSINSQNETNGMFKINGPEDLLAISPNSSRSNSESINNSTDRRGNVFQIEPRHCSQEQSNSTSDPNQILAEDATAEPTDNDDLFEIILSVYWRNGKFGAAYFNIQTSELFILDEIVDMRPEHLMLRNLYRQVLPVLIVTDPRLQDTFVKCIKSVIGTAETPESDILNLSNSRTKLHFVPSKEFNFESCKRRIFCLKLPNEPLNCTEDEREVFLRSIVNFNYTQTIHALGALLKYLDKSWRQIDMESSDSPTFLALHRTSLEHIVTIDDDSYKGLQIFNQLSHPSNFKKGAQNSTKEGLSLYNLFNKCSSKVGTQMMRILLKHPTQDLNVINSRLDTIAFCNKPGNEEIIKRICSCLRNIKNVNAIMTKINNLAALPYEWKLLYNTVYNAVLICQVCEQQKNSSALISQLGCCDSENLYQVALYMHQVIDFELSKVQGKFTVKAGLDPELDRKKQVISSLHGLMSNTAKYEIEELPTFVEECTMVYIPHLGYLLGVKAWTDTLTKDEKQLPGLKFMFQNHDYIHYKSKGCEELDRMIGDTYPEIMAHETRIMMRLTQAITEHLTSLTSIIKLCAELDCLISIASTCKEFGFSRPKLTKDKIINIKRGRHPLQELCIDSFVPNDTLSSEKDGLVKILSGPNASGKSVYLKQVALIAYLAHIGSYVPAESAEIGIVSHIYTRIQTVEAISTRMSAFLIDLRQMSLAIQESTTNSLIIIDEFGKGTTEVDGFALLAACLNNFVYRGNLCPHIFVSTHFHKIIDYLTPSSLIKQLSFEHIIQDGQLVFLYKLIEGGTDISFAHDVALSIGIDSKIIDRARAVLACIQENTLPPPIANPIFNKADSVKNNFSKLLECGSITEEKLQKISKH